MGYSRAEVRALLVKTLAHSQQGDTSQVEALLQAAINGLPDAQDSAASSLGRPNNDQRVVDALRKLGADKRFVHLNEVAYQIRVTPPAAAKALRRARDRHAWIGHQPKKGYYLDLEVRNATPTCEVD